jgi:hypothetical protein
MYVYGFSEEMRFVMKLVIYYGTETSGNKSVNGSVLLGSATGSLITKVTTVEGKGRKGMISFSSRQRENTKIERTRRSQLGRKVENSV